MIDAINDTVNTALKVFVSDMETLIKDKLEPLDYDLAKEFYIEIDNIVGDDLDHELSTTINLEKERLQSPLAKLLQELVEFTVDETEAGRLTKSELMDLDDMLETADTMLDKLFDEEG